MTQNKDIFGYYRVGDLKFYSKLEAIEMQARTGIHPHWDFNEAAYSSYDWTREPAESLTELYRQRAQQIREQYDHIVLWYSGGADSTNVLDTFIDNDIKIDELMSYTNYEVTGDKDHWLNAEIWRVALPRIEELRVKCPWMKFRMIDLGQFTVDNFKVVDIVESVKYGLNTCKSPHNKSRFDIRTKVKEWSDMIAAGKRVVMLHGLEKPRVAVRNNRYIFRFLDMVDSAVSPYAQAQNTAGDYDEYFYWSPDAPKIPIKQAHIIKNYLRLASPATPFMTSERSDLAYKELPSGEKLWLSVDGVHSLIYPTWKIDTFTVGKTPSPVFSKRDDWFLKEHGRDATVKTFYSALKHYWNDLPDYWKNDVNDVARGTKLSYSKEYYLE
jgi:hypothetical protein